MNAAKKALARTKNFVTDHKVAVTAIVTTAVITTAVVRIRNADIARLNEFLDKHDLTEEFYKHLNPEA